MIRYNFHTHTPRCNHAIGAEREYIESAISVGMQELGFADHCPVPFETDYISPIRMKMDEAKGYVDCIRNLAEEYKDKIKIYVGFEAEYMPKYFDKQMAFFDSLGIDYLIMGEHWWKDEEGGKYAGSPADKDDLHGYVDAIIEGMKTGRYKYLAHPDLINYPVVDDYYTSEMTRLCTELKAIDIPLEVNVLGYATNRHYPKPAFWDIASKVGNKAVIGMDAHEPEMVANVDAYKACRKLLDDRKIEFIENYTVVD